MRRFVLTLVLVLALAFVAQAGEGTIVSFQRGTLTVKVGDEEKKIMLRGVKVTNAEGKAVQARMRRAALKKDVKVELVEKDGKVVEIKIKK